MLPVGFVRQLRLTVTNVQKFCDHQITRSRLFAGTKSQTSSTARESRHAKHKDNSTTRNDTRATSADRLRNRRPEIARRVTSTRAIAHLYTADSWFRKVVVRARLLPPVGIAIPPRTCQQDFMERWYFIAKTISRWSMIVRVGKIEYLGETAWEGLLSRWFQRSRDELWLRSRADCDAWLIDAGRSIVTAWIEIGSSFVNLTACNVWDSTQSILV